jgi:2'-5' RNA ligase
LSTIRTFIAIEIPETVQQKIAKAQQELKAFNERISWTKPGNIHLTLKFLGSVEEDKIAAIAEAVNQVAEKIPPSKFRVKNLGAFPNLRRARVIWVGIELDSPYLSQLAEGMDAALAELGFPKEKRKFSPHLTIGRVKAKTSDEFQQALQRTPFEGGEVTVEEVIVMKSDLKPTGAIYTPLRKIKLGSHKP